MTDIHYEDCYQTWALIYAQFQRLKKSRGSVLELLFEVSFLVNKDTGINNLSAISAIFLMSGSKTWNDFRCAHLKLTGILTVLVSKVVLWYQTPWFYLPLGTSTRWTLTLLKGTVLCEDFQVRGIIYSSSLVWQLKERLRLPVSASPGNPVEGIFHTHTCAWFKEGTDRSWGLRTALQNELF